MDSFCVNCTWHYFLGAAFALALSSISTHAALAGDAAPTAGATDEAASNASFADAFWQYTVIAGFDYSAGHYGADDVTSILAIPVSLRAQKGSWTVRVDVSWLEISGPALLLDGSVVGTRSAGSASGPGDVNVYGTYSLDSFANDGVYIDFTARVKIPTASFSQGLGTGALDAAGQIDVFKTWGNFVPFVQFGYRYNGSPKGYALSDVVYGEVGLYYKWSEKLTTGALYDVRQAALPGEYTPQYGMIYVNYRLNNRWTLNVYGDKGFSISSPALGAGAYVTLRWP